MQIQNIEVSPDPPSIQNRTPSEVAMLMATTQSDSAIALAWNPPLETGGFPILSYEIEESTDSFNFVNVGSVATIITSFTRTGLNRDTLYYYRVGARNILGIGDYSNIASATTQTGINVDPVARAGADQIGITAGAMVTLDGSASSDPDGTIASYAWSQTSGDTVVLSNPAVASPTFTAPSTNSAQTLTFSLMVTDNDSATNTDTIDVGILAYVNLPPVARAGSDQTGIGSGSMVTLDGSASSDPDGTIASYAWTQTAGTTVVLSDASIASPTFTAPSGTAETLTFSLTVTDDDGATNSDSVNIGILAVANQPPVSRAGADQTGITAGATVTLDGSSSSDPDGTIASYAWTQTSGTIVSLSDVTIASPTFTAPRGNTADTLTFQLEVTDNDGATHTDSVDIGILAQLPPVARAGSDQSNIAAGATVTLDGSASSDPDGTIAIYAWSQTSGTTVALSSTSVASPTFSAPSTDNAQTLTFSLMVTDNDGATNTDTVDIAVLAYVNMPPVSRAGSDQSNIVAGSTVTLDGSASSDPDGSIASYAWSQTAGTTVSLSSTSIASPTFTAPSEASAQTLTFQLIVTDDDGSTNTDSVNIGVLAMAANQSPEADAGPDQSDIVAGATVTLDSSGSSDPDGTIASRLWSQTLGDTVVLSDTSAVSPTFTAPSTDSAQTLLFEVRVTDNDGATDIDSVQIGILAQVAQMSVFDSLAALTGVNNGGNAASSYVIDVTTSAMQQDYWEFSPSEGTLNQNFPTDMFTNTGIYWIERFRVQNNGTMINIHRGASTVLTSAFEGTWTDDWAWYFYSVDTGEYLILQANDENNTGGGFVTYNVANWTIVAQSTGSMTSTEWLNSLTEERIIIALAPVDTYRP